MTENLTKQLKKKKGFTLIELIIVVAIIAILAALAIPKLMGTQENAKKKADIANGKMIHDTVAKIMTEGTISSDAVAAFKVASGSATSTVPGAVWDGLQSKPKATYKTHKDFYITIDSDKNIIITVDSGTGNQVYPEQTGDYQ